MDLDELEEQLNAANYEASLKTSKNSQVMDVISETEENNDSDEEDLLFVDDLNDQNIGKDDDDDEGDLKTAALDIYDELRGSNKELALLDFLKWEETQELLESGALSKDNLALAIENCGVVVDSRDASLSFPMFYDLLQVIDDMADHNEITENFDDDDDDEGVDDSSKVGRNFVDDEDDEDDVDTDEEVLEMFEELSRGKDYILEKNLRTWDELEDLISAELASPKIIESYFNELDIQDGKIDLKNFKKFIQMLDLVLVDGEGNFLGMDELDRAIDLDEYDDDYSDDES